MEDYKPVSIAAVVAVVFSLASIVSFVTPVGLVLTLPSLASAMGSLWYGRHYPTEGRRLAIFGIGICTLLLISVPIAFYRAYAAESPAGYARLNFADVAQNELVHRHIGEQVCLKGFPIINSWSSTPVTELLFSPDGNRRNTRHGISVQLRSGTTWELYSEALAVSGLLEKCTHPDHGQPKYILRNAVIRRSRTPFDIAPPVFEGC